MTFRDQFARAFHKGSRPGSAVSGGVPSPIDHVQRQQFGGNYTDEQLYMGQQVMPEGQSQLAITLKTSLFTQAWASSS